MHTTTDHYRRSYLHWILHQMFSRFDYETGYLHWILHQMFSRFDYETGLKAINDKAAYRSWLSANRHK